MIIHTTHQRAAPEPAGVSAELPADGFLRHKGLILVAASGAVAEAGLLTLLAPGALPLAPQETALPVLAAYHDLRWLFADSQSWPRFTGIAIAALLARSALDAMLLRLAWPRGLRAPRLSRVLVLRGTDRAGVAAALPRHWRHQHSLTSAGTYPTSTRSLSTSKES